MNYLREFEFEWEGQVCLIRVISWDATEARGEWDLVAIEEGGYTLEPHELLEGMAEAIEEEIHDHFKGATYHD